MIRKISIVNPRQDVYTDEGNRIIEIFDTKTGYYERHTFNEGGLETDQDAFMRDMPGLIDIGIMGHCKNATFCKVGCYQGGKTSGAHMTLEDYKSIIDQVDQSVMQVALGGAGDPNDHPDFEKILEYTTDHGIVPNYTTSGIGVTSTVAELTKKYCGAVAVSWYNMPYTFKAIDLFRTAGCKTNIHYVLSRDSIDEATRRLLNDDFPKSINAVIFLLHKPVGKGSIDRVLDPNDPRLATFFSLVNKPHSFKIGFDSCSIPGVINYAPETDMNALDTCEGSRYSCYIHSDMVMVPCSFDQERRWGVSLRDYTISEAWHSPQFGGFRLKLQLSCPDCPSRSGCMGGCPVIPSIVLCNKEMRSVV